MLILLASVVGFLVSIVVLIIFIAMYFKLESINDHLKKIRTLIEWQVTKNPEPPSLK